jgi:autotransporter-associated beta strand protein
VQVVTGVLHQVSLQVTSMGLVTQYWDGTGVTGNGVISGGSGTWNSTTTNWTTSDGLSNSTWQGGVAVFDVPGGTVTLAAPINAQGLTFGSTGYTLSGTSPLNLVGTLAAPPTISVGSGFTTTIGAPVTGITGFSANGSGTLILTSVTNSYTGGTTIANGTVQIGTTAVGGSMGGGTISIANGGTLSLVNLHGNVLASNVTNGVGSTGTLIVSATTANTLSGALTDGASGNLALTQSGTGTTTLTNAGNSFSGATTISKGILQIGTVAAAGSLGVTSAVSVNNGTTLSIVNVAGGTLANNISNGSSGTGLVNVASTGSNTLNGVLTNGTGVLALTQSGTGVTTLTGSDTYTGATTVSAGTLQIGNGTTGNIASTSAVTVIGTGTLATDLADTSAFSNSVNLNAAGASLKAVQTVTNTITGVISGTGVVKQTGTGTTVLTAANTYKGGTTVSGGTLLVNNVSGSGTGTGAVAINNGGTLGGTGAIAGATTLNNGGTLFPGSGSMGTPGTILHATSMIWNSGGTLTLQLGSSANDALALTGALTKGSAGAYTLDILDDGGIPLGNYTLATFASTTFAPANFTLEMPLGYAGQLTKTSTSLILDVESGSGQLPAHSESADLTMAADPAGTPMQTIDSDNSSLSVTPTPEPSSALLLAFGGCALLSWRRRRNG